MRWLNRDPIGENGEVNLYRFVANNSITAIDPLGLSHRNDPPGKGVRKVSVPAIGEYALTPWRCSSSSLAWRASFVCSYPGAILRPGVRLSQDEV
jgi:hypothetical protein